jgi:hypothetical protein
MLWPTTSGVYPWDAQANEEFKKNATSFFEDSFKGFLGCCGGFRRNQSRKYFAADKEQNEIQGSFTSFRMTSFKEKEFGTLPEFALVGVEDFFVDVGPELFEGEVGGVDDIAGEPLLSDLGPGAVFGGVVESGDAGGCA